MTMFVPLIAVAFAERIVHEQAVVEDSLGVENSQV
jgi:hypothetical protein